MLCGWRWKREREREIEEGEQYCMDPLERKRKSEHVIPHVTVPKASDSLFAVAERSVFVSASRAS